MNVLSLIKRLASDFDLIFNEGDYCYIKVKQKEYLLGIFLGGCSDPEMMEYGGKNKKERARRINEYMKSESYKRVIKGRGGTLLNKKTIKDFSKTIKLVKDDVIRKELEVYNKRLKNKLEENKDLVIVTDDESLIHEFIHVLMNNNGLNFSSIKDNWKWNEGLVTYLEYYIINKQLTPPKDPMNKIYYEYAKKWEKLLKNSKTPAERKEIIKKKYDELK